MPAQLTVVLGAALLVSAWACGGSQAYGGSSCAQACAQIPACGTETTNCVAQCNEANAACASTGHALDFDELLACLGGAHYTCEEGGPSTTDCATQQQTVTSECVALPPLPLGDAGFAE
jgi:hypothetical protein